MEYFQISLKIRLQVLGDFHPLVGMTYNNIGIVLDDQGNYDQALEYYQKSLEIKIRVHGYSHSTVSNSNFCIGLTLIQLGRYNDAIEHLLDGYKFNKAGGFPYNIGKCHEALGQDEDAVRYYIESAEIRYDQLGADHEATIDARDKAVKLASKLDRRSDLPDWFLDVGHGE